MKNLNIILSLVIIILLLLLGYYYNRGIKESNKNWTNNLKALNDTIRITQDKFGNKIHSISALETSMEDLKLLNNNLYKELTLIKGKIQYGSSYTVSVNNTDTLYSKDSIFITKIDTSEMFISKWDFSDSLWTIKGGSIFDIKNKKSESYISQRNIKLDLITGITEEKGKKRIFVKSKDPSVIIENLVGADLTNKKTKFYQKFFIGPSISGGFDINGKPNALLGFSFGYNLLPNKK